MPLFDLLIVIKHHCQQGDRFFIHTVINACHCRIPMKQEQFTAHIEEVV